MRVPSVYDRPSDEVPVYMRAESQGYEPYYNTTGSHGAVSSELDICSNVEVAGSRWSRRRGTTQLY